MTSNTQTSTEQSWWRNYLAFPLIWKMAIALAAGVIVGLIVGPDIAVIQPLGDLFLRLLLMIVIPVIVATLIVGVSSITPSRLGRIGGKVLLFYMFTSTVAITIGISLALAINPGSGLSMPADGEEPEEAPDLVDTLLGIVPENPFEALAEGNILAIVFGAILVGLAIGVMRNSTTDRLRDLGELLRRFAEGVAELMFLVIRGVLEYAPIGVFALIAVVVGETGLDALQPLAMLTGTVYAGIALQIAVYCLILYVFRVSIPRFFSAAREPMVTAFVTRSSNGTLPVSMRAAQRLGVREGVYGFSLPFGATINMDGTALYIGASVVFVANVSDVSLSFTQILTVVLVGVLASIGTAGVPGQGLIMLSLAISQAGLPFAPVALVAGIDALLDMARTMGNVTGDLTGTRVVAGTEDDMLAESESQPERSPDHQRSGTR